MPKVLNRLIVVAVEKPSCCGHGHNDLNVIFNVFYMEFNLTNFVGILICFTFFQSFSQQIYELDTSPKCLYNVVVARVFLSILDHV